MKTWVKYGAAIMGLLIVSALIISFGMKKRRVLQRHKSHVYKRNGNGGTGKCRIIGCL